MCCSPHLERYDNWNKKGLVLQNKDPHAAIDRGKFFSAINPWSKESVGRRAKSIIKTADRKIHQHWPPPPIMLRRGTLGRYAISPLVPFSFPTRTICSGYQGLGLSRQDVQRCLESEGEGCWGIFLMYFLLLSITAFSPRFIFPLSPPPSHGGNWQCVMAGTKIWASCICSGAFNHSLWAPQHSNKSRLRVEKEVFS